MDYKKGGGLILSSEQAQLVDGLWTIQKYGDFAPGDKRLARVFVTGRVEMRQLGGLFKLSFDGLAAGSDWQIILRKAPLKQRCSLLAKAKKRMADLEETGYSVPISRDLDKNGFVCSGDATLGTFDLTLRNAPDNPLLYRGLCITKSAQDTPLTEEPAVYGFVRFVDDRPQITTTENVLGLHENEDLMGNKTIMHDGTDSKYKPISIHAHRTAQGYWTYISLIVTRGGTGCPLGAESMEGARAC